MEPLDEFEQWNSPELLKSDSSDWLYEGYWKQGLLAAFFWHS